MKKMLPTNFKKRFALEPEYFVQSSGRFEVIGNHTDHNGGLCVAASCDLAIDGYLTKSNDKLVHIYSEGYEDFSFSLDDVSIVEKEIGTSIGLTKGVAKYFIDHNYKVGGFYLVIESTIFKGAGVSSSAAFESLIAQIFNVVFNDSKISSIELAKAGQYSENNYFGKKSGLLDQSAICFGNISFMNFSSLKVPEVKTISFPFSDMQFVIINTGGSHAELSDLYSAIPVDMKNVAKKLGKEVLGETTMDEVEKIKDQLSDIEYSRAKHFFEENERVLTLVKSLQNQDKQMFIKSIRGSFVSSSKYLKNMMVSDNYKGSPLEACDYAYEFLGEDGACKINGGGFAGSIIACVPKIKAKEFVEYMAKKYGHKNISEVNINPYPPLVEKLN